MDGVGKSLNAPVVIGWAAIGIVLAAAVLIAALRRRISTGTALVLSLLLLLLAAPAHWFVSFAPGMMLADTFLIDGGDYAPWGMWLYGVSAAAGVALSVLGIMMGRQVPQS
ncbi:hypothetical protein BJH93_05010 [Kocuria polaris]|nr:hypothetical protein [Kocuria polaris]